MAATEAQKRAVKAHRDKLRAMGHKRVAFWLPPDLRAMLEVQAEKLGSRQRAIEAAIEAAGGENG